MRGRGGILSGVGALLAWAAFTAGGCGPGEEGAQPPPLHLLASEGATHPTAAVDPRDGTAYVAWVQLTGEGDDHDVLLVRLPPGGEPEPPVRVNREPGTATPHEQAPPRVAVGPGGEVYVLWQHRIPVPGRRFGASTLYLARSLDGGRTFEPAVEVADYRGPVPASHTFHDLLVTPEGRLVASWLDGRASAELEAAGIHGEEGGSQVRIAVSRDGGRSFGRSVRVASEVCPCCRTVLALDGGGALLVGWRHIWKTEDGREIRDLALARSEDGGERFGDPVRIHADGWLHEGCPHAGPALAADGGGTLHALWYTGTPSAPGVFHARSVDGGRTFGAATPLVTGEWVPPSRVSLVSLGDGAVWAAWEDRREEPPTFGLMRIPAGGPPSPGQAERVAGTFPELAAGHGRRVVTWLDGESIWVRIEGQH